MISLRPYQQKGLEQLYDSFRRGHNNVIFRLATGGGKCQSADTPILLHNGSVKKAKDIVVGDKLMGPDSSPRNVRSICSGEEEMFRMTPIKGDSFEFNRSHMLSLRASYTKYGFTRGQIVDISISDYLRKNKTFKHQFKWTRVGVDFPAQEVEFDPYFVGLYLAEGTHRDCQITNPDKEVIEYLNKNFSIRTNKTGIEHTIHTGTIGRKLSALSKLRREITGKDFRLIPERYRINSRENRLKLLAGLLDGDGYLHHNHYEIITKYDQLNDDILYLCRSLGIAAYSKIKIGKIKSIGFEGEYHRITISGELDEIPCKIKRKQASKRKQIKSVLNVGFKLESQGVGEYYGFEIDGDNRYLLGDFSVTHNTRVFCRLIEDCVATGMNVVVVMRRRELIRQTSKVLDGFDIEHGIYMAGDPRFRPSRKVQVCSIDTLGARELYPHEGNSNTIVIVDESHDCNPRGKKYATLFSKYKECKIAGFSATPFADNSMFDDIIYPITDIELMEQGFKVPVKCFVPNIIDVSKVNIKRTGQFDEEELFKACANSEVIGNIVDDWLKYGQNRKTVLFAVNIAHSKMLCDAFNDRGIPAIHCDGGTKSGDRDRALRKLKNNEIKILCNVNIFSTGLDVPEIECIIFARPTRSIIYFLQAIGRGLRPAPQINKKNCIIIDNAGNTLRFGSPYQERDAHIGKAKPLPKGEIEDITIRTCKQCFYIFDVKQKLCPECGFVNPVVVREIKTKAGDLIELDLTPEELEVMKRKEFKSDFFKLKFVAENRVYKGRGKPHQIKDWVCNKLEEKHGLTYCQDNEEIISQYL